MLNIEGGRSCLYQWDVDQRLEVMSGEIIEVHFVNAVTSPALVCEVYEEGGRRFANVPNILLQQSWPIQAYGCCGSRVRDVLTCKVIRREKPADYVYTETEVKTFASLEERIEAVGLAKLDKNQGTQNAGQLLWINPEGSVVPLALGAGLEIRAGVLMVTNTQIAKAICGEILCGEVNCGEV